MDDSDEEYEPFHMTGEEFMPKRRKMTKKDHIYGMWADHDSDEDNDRRKDYSRPVNFVSSNKPGEDAAEGQDGDSDSDVEDLDEEARVILKSLESKKLEKGGVKTGVGKFASAALEKNKTLGMFSGSGDKGAGASKQKQNTAKKRVFQTGRTADREFGGWEKYSSGFGSKMLAKMGWEKGTGLGAKGEGIVNPVKATKHTEFGKGLAHMQVNKPTSVVEAVDSEDEEEQKQFEAQLQQWKKTEEKEAKPKYNYMTVEDLMHSGKQYRSRETKSTKDVKVIDMTGPKQRVLSSYEEIHHRHTLPDQHKDSEKLYVSELLHNIELLVETTEQDILQSDRKLHYNRDLVLNLSHEREGLLEEVAAEEEQMDKLTDILSTIEICERRILSKESDSSLTLNDCENMMTSLMEKYPAEYKTYGLSSLAVAIVFRLIKTTLKGWDMLSEPTQHVKVFSIWKGLLQEHETVYGGIPSSENMDPYDRLVWEIWMPCLRQALLKWSPRHCDPLIKLLETWTPLSLIPTWIMDNIKHQLILPRLQNEVESWDPTTDTMPIHRWIHPWLPLLKQDLEVLYAPIRHKLAMALTNWHPSDSSAHKILEPWIQVFSPQTMDMFVLRTILPKLIYTLQIELQINPHQQNIAPFEWVMAWRDMIGAHHYANILDKYFFPKWIQVLLNWLSSNPNFDEISKWYSGWKSLLDVDILREPVVKHHLNHALDLMNRAVAGNFQPGARENMAYLISTERRNLPSIQNAISAPASVSFKDVIEKMALDNGILFMPVSGQKRHEGKALYSFGRATMYIDRSVVFVLRGTEWSPVSLDDLLKCA